MQSYEISNTSDDLLFCLATSIALQKYHCHQKFGLKYQVVTAVVSTAIIKQGMKRENKISETLFYNFTTLKITVL